MISDILKNWAKWDFWIKDVDEIQGLTKTEKGNVIEAFNNIRNIFGDDFLQSVISTKHPLISLLVNRAPWTRKWLIWFSEGLAKLRKRDNFAKFIGNLKNAEKFAVSLAELIVADKFIRAGFDIKLYPTIKVRDREKIPEFMIKNTETSEEFYVEVCKQKASEIEKEASETFSRISNLFIQAPGIESAGRIHKPLSKTHLQAILKKLDALIQEAVTTKQMKELIEEHTLEIAVAPIEEKEDLDQWAKDHGLGRGTLEGPRYDVDELNRLKNTIKREQRQLPKDVLNMIVIENQRFFLTVKDMEKAISLVEEAVYDYPHLLACVAFTVQFGAGENKHLIKNNHFYIKKTRGEFSEECLFLLNTFIRDKSVSPSSFSKIMSAFARY